MTLWTVFQGNSSTRHPLKDIVFKSSRLDKYPNKINTVKKEKMLWKFKGDRTYMWLAEDGMWKECIEDTASKIGPAQWIGYREGTQSGEGCSTQRQQHEKSRLNAGKRQNISQNVKRPEQFDWN